MSTTHSDLDPKAALSPPPPSCCVHALGQVRNHTNTIVACGVIPV